VNIRPKKEARKRLKRLEGHRLPLSQKKSFGKSLRNSHPHFYPLLPLFLAVYLPRSYKQALHLELVSLAEFVSRYNGKR
jgi:hypothetical protein